MTSASRIWALAIALSVALSAPLFAETAEEKLARLPEGYVAPEDMPDSLILVPPPPSPGSAAQALDTDIAASTEALQDTARFDLARRDANLEFPEATNAFACALGARITAEDTPRLQQLMLRALVDAGSSTYHAKNAYDRSRPFTQNGNAICTPDQKEFLRNDGSYPSGHTAIGWAWAMILAEIAPEGATALLARGLAFGESRSVCNVHWHSDIVMGRMMGAAVVPAMNANPEFQKDLAAARSEIANAPDFPGRDCGEETTVLAIGK